MFMKKKFFVLLCCSFFLFAGCISQKDSENIGVSQNDGVADIYGSAKEVAMPSTEVKEIKSILAKVCGEVKFTENLMDPGSRSPIWVYTWKKEPTEAALINSFQEKGYELVVDGEPLFVSKGGLTFIVSWDAEKADQQIAVMVTKNE